MKTASRWRVVGLTALLFVVLFGVLTGLRVWNLEPPTPVQSLIVNCSAVVIVGGTAYYASRGGGVVDCWLLALAPSLAFTLNLSIPVAVMDSLAWIIYPLASAAGIALVLGGVGFLGGYVTSRIRAEQNAPEST